MMARAGDKLASRCSPRNFIVNMDLDGMACIMYSEGELICCNMAIWKNTQVKPHGDQRREATYASELVLLARFFATVFSLSNITKSACQRSS